jgi:hypothetical protein
MRAGDDWGQATAKEMMRVPLSAAVSGRPSRTGPVEKERAVDG